MIESERRTKLPWPSWLKGLFAFGILIATGILVFLSVGAQSTYVTVEEAISGKYQEGANLQVHGIISDLKVEDCILIDGNLSLKIDISSLVLPDTFAEDKGATFTGYLIMVEGELVLNADKVQMGCPSKYEPAEESTP